MVIVLLTLRRLSLATRCGVCGKNIHIDHEQGELMKCLVILSEYKKVMDEFVRRLRVLDA